MSRGTATLITLRLSDVRGYAQLDAAFGPGAHLIWGPNAAGKTTLVEAIVLLATGRSQRTTTDAEVIRWGADVARAAGEIAEAPGQEGRQLEVALIRGGSAIAQSGARKQIRVNGVGRRAAALGDVFRTVAFGPEDMLLVAGSPTLRRAALDELTAAVTPGYGAALATYNRALAQRNRLLRAIREEEAEREELRYWDVPLVEAGGEIVAERLNVLNALAGPLARAHAEIAPEEAGAALGLRYETNASALLLETPRDALARRLAETAEKEVWNGATLVGPHRDDIVFGLAGRDLAAFASRGQQRTAILALKLAELELLTAHHGRPPLLLLDDVFSELDPERRAHLVRRIGALPQAFITTTALGDLDPNLVAIATTWEVRAGEAGAELVGPSRAAGIGARP